MKLAAGLLACLALSIALAPAMAGHCDTNVVIFFGPHYTNPSAGICLVTDLSGVETPDARYITPGASDLRVRYVGDVGEDVLSGDVNGVPITLTINAARTSYTSPTMPYDGSDVVTATVHLDAETSETTVYGALPLP